ncbi:MAG TPA: lysophospholipid acyltransferase family protein [Gemmatimonadales bacterium]|nr:lysophospholipid acyltransferase family protein [Gemmatimonadales bacterium]
MIAAIRLVVTVLLATIWYGLQLIVAGLFRVRYREGGIYDSIPRNYGRFILRANGLSVNLVHPERLSGVQPCVYIGNHSSWLDVLAVVDVLPGSVRFTPKKELIQVPLFGQALKAGKHLAIDRDNRASAVAAYEQAAAMIREGISAIVFPEGTRSRDGNLQEFKKGPFVLAMAAQVPVVPLWIAGTRDALPRGTLRLRPGPIEVRVGESIPTTGLTYEHRDELVQRCRAVMEELRAG